MASAEKYKEPRGCVPTNPTKRRWLFFGLPLAIVLVAAVAVGVAVGVSNNKSSSRSPTPQTTGSTDTTFAAAANGRNGSTVTTDEGVSFTYINWLGGTWAQDPEKPYSVSTGRQGRRLTLRYLAGHNNIRRVSWKNGYGVNILYEV
jgi:hypothetical protein